MITTLSSYSLSATRIKSDQIAISSYSQTSKTSKEDEGSSNSDSNTLTISTLSTQLAASAKLIDERVATLSPDELAKKTKAVLSQIEGDSYFANKAKYDSEVPNTNDPELLNRAKQATAFVNSAAQGSKSEKNPFVGLSREQLSNVVNDDSGTYTVNERRAASYEADSQEEEWRVKVTSAGMSEYNNSGKMTNFFTAVLDHFKALPTIEQALYPKEYATDLQSRIDLDFNYRTNQAGDDEKTQQSFLDMIFESLSKNRKSTATEAQTEEQPTE
jgi:hypothetical protein